MIRKLVTTLALLAVSASTAFSATYDLTKATPVGSWATLTSLTVDAKGKGTMLQQKQSLVGEEKRNGQDYLWIEVKTETYKYKKGQQGDKMGEPAVMKMLVAKRVFKGDVQSILSDPENMVAEFVMQAGEQDPMVIEPGSMMWKMVKMGLKWALKDIELKEAGSDKVNVAAGSFKTNVFQLTGEVAGEDVSGKQWISDKVPFGIVKTETTAGSGKKAETTTSELTGYGKSGAVSEIKGEAKAMKIPGLGNLFGN